MIKYIFCINTGRSGSHYLSSILTKVQGIASLHEPEPGMNGKPMAKYLMGRTADLEALMDKKLQQINSALDGNTCYIETNHTFIKGFGWLLPSKIAHDEIGVIILKRKKDEIVKSLYRINSTPLTPNGYAYLMNPLMKDAVNKVHLTDKIKYLIFYLCNGLVRFINSEYHPFKLKVRKPGFLRDYELKMLDWYVDETYAQGEKWTKMFPDIKVYETTTYQLNDVENIRRIFDFFGVPFKPAEEFYKSVGVATNG